MTLISTSSRQIHSGMSPGWIAGHYSIDECSIPLSDLASRAHASFHAATVTRLSLADGEVATEGRASEWTPQRYALYLLSTGDGKAIAAWRSSSSQ